MPARRSESSVAGLVITEVDPQGTDALALLREAAEEARAIYPELLPLGAALPTNAPTPARGVYVVAYLDGQPVASGALRPLEELVAEMRRVFVVQRSRRKGVGEAILLALEAEAHRIGYTRVRLETGYRQFAAMSLYESRGFSRIEPFGEHVNDPTSVCYEKCVTASGATHGERQ